MSTERAFEVPSLVINDRAGIVSFDVDPITTGFAAPIGSLGLRSTGEHYRKWGALDTNWDQIDGPKELQFCNRAGVMENVAIIDVPTYQLPFFNRAGVAENIGII